MSSVKPGSESAAAASAQAGGQFGSESPTPNARLLTSHNNEDYDDNPTAAFPTPKRQASAGLSESKQSNNRSDKKNYISLKSLGNGKSAV